MHLHTYNVAQQYQITFIMILEQYYILISFRVEYKSTCTKSKEEKNKRKKKREHLDYF